jgi:3-oxoacyl-[acyl-carrier-protein] synthase-3
MTPSKKTIAAILGLGSAIPEKVVTNFDLAKIVDTSDEWIKTRTGIAERRVITEGEGISTLAVAAVQKALKDAAIKPEEIGLIVTATTTPDYIVFPSTGCLIQRALGLKDTPAFDISAACSGFIYALSVGRQFVENGTYEYVLVVGADCLSQYLNWNDRSTCVLFGDGAGAVVLGPSLDGERGIKSIWLGADGAGAELLMVPAGGSKKPLRRENIHLNEQYITMNGPEVYKFAVRIIERATAKALEIAGVSAGDLDLFVPHQANTRIIEHAARKLGIPAEKVFINVSKYGNTSAASIPIALEEAVSQKKLEKGNLVALVGFGAGLTWGASIVRW